VYSGPPPFPASACCSAWKTRYAIFTNGMLA